MGKNKKSLSLTKHQSGHFGRKCVKKSFQMENLYWRMERTI